MATFHFRVLSSGNAIETMTIESDTETEALRRLSDRGITPIERVKKVNASPWSHFSTDSLTFRRFDAVAFTERLVPLLQAGIALERALQIIEQTCEDETEREIVIDLRVGLHEGKRFSKLIRDNGDRFPRVYANVVEAGEEAGALPEVLAELYDFLKLDRETRKFIISSSIYPLFVISVCVIVLMVLLTVVIPRFAGVITNSGREATLGTEVLLKLAEYMQNWWWLGPILLITGIIGGRIALRHHLVQAAVSYQLLRLPFIKQVVLLNNLTRFTRTMSVLLKNGVHLLDAVKISTGVVSNPSIRDSISDIALNLRKGERLSDALKRSRYIPSLVIHMLGVGEETGAPDEMLARVSTTYEMELRQLIRQLLAWFEPLVIVFLGGIVGTVVLLLFLAILDMQSGI